MHDLAIRRGIVIDGTGQDRRNADVAVGLVAGSHTHAHTITNVTFSIGRSAGAGRCFATAVRAGTISYYDIEGDRAYCVGTSATATLATSATVPVSARSHVATSLILPASANSRSAELQASFLRRVTGVISRWMSRRGTTLVNSAGNTNSPKKRRASFRCHATIREAASKDS